MLKCTRERIIKFLNISEIVPASVRIQSRTNTWNDNDLTLSIDDDWFLRFFFSFFFFILLKIKINRIDISNREKESVIELCCIYQKKIKNAYDTCVDNNY